MTHYVEWRAFVGPAWKPDTDSAFWDWSALNAGATYAPEAAIAPTTLASTLSAGVTSVVLADASTWPSAGSAFIGPNGANQVWEQISWTGKSGNTLTGVTRETVDTEQTGVHSAGAAARFWFPLDMNDGGMSFVSQFDDRYVVRDWALELTGVAWPQVALRNQNLILVQWRWDTGTGLGSWSNAFVGWLDSPQGRDDFERLAEWRVRVNSSLGVLRYDEADGIRVGNVDLAEGASVTASSTLEAARTEQHTGDFTGEPSFSASNTIDGDSGSLWISERYVGENNVPTNPGTTFDGMTGSRLISQVHIAPYVGQGQGYRWIEITYVAGGTYSGDWIVAGDGYYANLESFSITAEAGDAVIFAENPALFEEENPDHDAAQVVDLADYQLWSGADAGSQAYANEDASSIFDHITVAGGNLRLYNGPSGLGQSQMVWGSGTRKTSWAPEWVNNVGGASANITAPAPGQTMRYIYAPSSPTQAANYWQTSYIATPGYTVRTASKVWLLYGLPRLDLRLHADIDNSVTSVTIADAAGETGDGLPDSGTLQIGSEQMTYSAINRDSGVATITARGANSTAAAAHSEGDKVYIVDGGVATDGRLVNEIVLTLPSDISAKLSDFVVRGSKLTTSRAPGDANYTDDYSTLATASNNTDAEYTVTLSPAQRLRWVLVEVTEMTVSPARPRLAEITFAEDMSVYGADTLTSATVADAVEAMLSAAGLPAGAIIDNGDTSTIDNYTTAVDATGGVLAEVAEFAGVRVTVGRDSKITIASDPFWGSGSLPSASLTFDADDIAVYEKVDTNGRGVGQVELSWRNAADTESGIERYPVTRVTGRVVRVGPIVRSSSSAAQVAAEKRYWMMRRPYTVVAELQEAYILTAGDVHQVSWHLDDEMLPLNRLYMVISADHQIRDNAMVTVAQYIQISRSDER